MQLRFVVAIPIYNHPKTIHKILNDCLRLTDLPIVVIDDGSNIPVENLCREVISNKDNSDRVTFLRHNQNKGKGAAILTATEFAVSKSWTHLVTIDADGQHEVSDIQKLIAAALLNPWAVVLGDRQMNTKNVPKSSVFGKSFSNFWVKYETELQVSDSQSGFRIYPLFYLQSMNFFSHRYDFEVEVLTRLIWKNIKIVSVPIQVNYFPSEQRVTHFHKIKDNLRLVILNTILVSTSILKRNDSPIKSAIATGVGVFVGCLPFYGLHSLIVAFIALLFRINFIYLFLGTQISIPPMVPVIIIGAKYISTFVTGHPPVGFFGFSKDWIYGILLFGFIMAIIISIAVYILKLRQNHQTRKVSIKSSDGLGIFIMKFFLKHIGLKFTYFCLNFIVPFYFLFSVRSRKASKEFSFVLNKNNYFLSRQKILWNQIYTFSKILVDRAYQKMSFDKKFEIIEGQGVVELKSELKKNIGIIFLQSHFGGWDISFNYFQHMDTGKQATAVMYGNDEEFQHTSLNNKTDRFKKIKIEYFNQQNETALKLTNLLSTGQIVGLMGDRPVGRSFELVLVLGKLALIDTSAIRLSYLMKTKIFAIICVKKSLFQYEIMANEINLKKSDEKKSREDQIIEIAKQYADNLSLHIKNNPEQWFNFYPFWSELNL